MAAYTRSSRDGGNIDVLFTHSWHLWSDPKQAERRQPYPPLGTLYAAALARESGFSVAMFDTMLDDPAVGFEDALDRLRPKLVVICEDSFNFISKMCLTQVREVSFTMLESAQPRGVPVVIHGSDSTDNALEYLHRGFAAVLQGECETTLIELLNAYLRRSETQGWSFAGLNYLDAAGGLVSTGRRRPSVELDRYPAPARDLIRMESYRAIWRERHGRASTNLIASRGCPFHCNWCAKPIFGNKFALRSPELVAAEMRMLKQKYEIEHLWFADDVFALDRHWVKDFAQAVGRRHAELPFKIQTRADLLSVETVEALRLSGCEEAWLGAESGSQKILNAMDKGLSVAAIERARDRLGNAGIRAAFFLQFGYPGESLSEIEETVALVRRTMPDDIGVSVSYPLPGTVFHERVHREMGLKHHWRHSDEFYRALRNALHAEVTQYTAPEDREAKENLSALWSSFYAMEERCRNRFPTALPVLQQSSNDATAQCAVKNGSAEECVA